MMNGTEEGEELGLKYLRDYNMEVMFIESLAAGVGFTKQFLTFNQPLNCVSKCLVDFSDGRGSLTAYSIYNIILKLYHIIFILFIITTY